MIGNGGRQNLTLSQQLLFLRSSPTIEGAGTLSGEKLTWQMAVQPTPLARTYRVNIAYRPGETPSVQIADPDLQLLASGRPLPHVYNNPVRLCLNLPRTGEWEPTKRIDQTIGYTISKTGSGPTNGKVEAGIRARNQINQGIERSGVRWIDDELLATCLRFLRGSPAVSEPTEGTARQWPKSNKVTARAPILRQDAYQRYL